MVNKSARALRSKRRNLKRTTFIEAITGENASQWRSAIKEELVAHEKNNTWTLVPLPENRNIIGCKWVFKIKENPTENNVRFKARLCAKGFSQKAGLDYTETFSPVVRYDSIRVLLAIAACENLEIGQFDIKTAFINGFLNEEIYMQLPEGVETNNENTVCKLNKALYGLKQAARCWNKQFHEFLEKFNFQQCNADQCVYLGQLEREKVYLALYVDDGLILTSSRNILNKVLEALNTAFEMTKGNGDIFVGMEIERDRSNNIIFIHQKHYVKRLLVRFNMSDANPVSIPADPHAKLRSADVDSTIS